MKAQKNSHKHSRSFHEICDYLGEDLDSKLCKGVKEHLDSCPECKIYIDSIKKTVKLCKENEKSYKTPKNCKDKILNYIKKSVGKKKE